MWTSLGVVTPTWDWQFLPNAGGKLDMLRVQYFFSTSGVADRIYSGLLIRQLWNSREGAAVVGGYRKVFPSAEERVVWFFELPMETGFVSAGFEMKKILRSKRWWQISSTEPIYRIFLKVLS